MRRLLDKNSEPLSIKNNMLWNSAGSICNLGCQWLISVLIVRLSGGYDSAGLYSLAMALYNIFGSIAQYRMYTYQISDVDKENTTGEYFSFRLITGLSALAMCILYGVATCDSNAWGVIALFSLYKTISLLIDVLHATDQQNHRMDYIGKSLSMQGLISLGLFAAVFSFSRSLELTLLMMSVGILLVGILFDLRKTRNFGPIVAGISRKKVIKLLVSCFPIVLAGIIASSTSSIPRQMLSDSLGSGALGAYASVAAPVAIIQMGASYIYNPLLGYFSETYHRGDLPEFMRLLGKSFAAIIAIGLICVAAFAVFGEWLLVLVFGDSILPYTYLLLPLVFLALVTGIQWFLNDLLIALRSFRATLFGSVVSFVAAVVFTYPLIGQLGSNGVTVSGLIAAFLGIAIMLAALVGKLRPKGYK